MRRRRGVKVSIPLGEKGRPGQEWRSDPRWRGGIGMKEDQLGFQDNRKMGRQTDIPGGGECEGNVGLADGQGGEEADEGPPVHHPHHAQPPPHRLRSLHHCTLPQIFSAIFPFT